MIIVTSKAHNRNRVLLYYLFQENKSFGSKTPFAFILWCTGSCVEHRWDISPREICQSGDILSSIICQYVDMAISILEPVADISSRYLSA
jgi:hypothetical protein